MFLGDNVTQNQGCGKTQYGMYFFEKFPLGPRKIVSVQVNHRRQLASQTKNALRLDPMRGVMFEIVFATLPKNK